MSDTEPIECETAEKELYKQAKFYYDEYVRLKEENEELKRKLEIATDSLRTFRIINDDEE
jgi:hypothetical protein